MDQIMLPSIGIMKVVNEIKWTAAIHVLLAVTSSAAVEAANEPSPAISQPRSSGLKINPPMAIVLACLLSAFLLICLSFFYFRHCAERQLALASTLPNRGQRRSTKLAAACGLDPTVIATFTTFTYSVVKEIKIGKNTLECAVCLIEFTDHETLRLLPECNHVFHRGCIDKWLALRVTCPVCRASLLPKPNQPSSETETELYFGPNGPTKGHVSLEVFDMEHDLSPARKLSRSYSAEHFMVERRIEDVERYTLRLSKEAQNVLKSVVSNSSMKSNQKESSLKRSLKSASANFVRGSDYFDYKRFGQERQHDEGNSAMTISPNTSGGSTSGYVDGESRTSSQRFIMFVKSPLSRLFQTSNNNTDIIGEGLTDKLSPINKV